uniref:Uncharacterized protein n=1 Tax=Rhizophora mucronata TaxID=61149 RepID=A0A2P2PQA8_RHIMU
MGNLVLCTSMSKFGNHIAGNQTKIIKPIIHVIEVLTPMTRVSGVYIF